MPEQKNNQRASSPEWLASTVRLTVFPGLLTLKDSEGWWEELAGQPSEQVVNRRGELQESGSTDKGQFILTVDSVRIDWRIVSIDDSTLLSGDITSLIPFSQSIDYFLEIMMKWLEKKSYKFERIAFGAELLFPVESRQEAYKELSKYLPSVKLDIDNSSDFLYQINRPRSSQSSISGLQINRLSKWSGLKLSRGYILPTGKPISFPDSDLHFCRLELDINTAAEFNGEIPSKQVPAIFRELVALGREISLKGDIP